MTLPQEKAGYTFADYLTWDENFRCELIDGVCFVDGQIYRPFSEQPISFARPSINHQRVSRNLMLQIHQYLEGKQCEVFSEIDVLLAVENKNDEDITNVFTPDLSIICDKSKLHENYCLGAPDMIVEILSKSTMRNDKILKYNAYQNIGVKEYWLIDPIEKSVQVFLLKNEMYQPVDLYGETDTIKINTLQGCFIELSKVFQEE